MLDPNEIKIVTLGHQDIEAISNLHLKYFPARTLERLEWQLFGKDLPDETLLTGARYEDRLVATQAFIPVKARYRGREVMACKSELSLVDQDFSNQRIFSRIYKKGVELLEKKGYDCIFGFTQVTGVFKSLGFDIAYPRHIELLVFNPPSFARKKLAYERFWLDEDSSAREGVPTIGETEDVEFSLVRDESYMRHWYLNNPWRSIVSHDEENGVIYSCGLRYPMVCVSEHAGLERMKESIRKSLKGNRMKWVALCRKTNRKALGWATVPGAIYLSKQRGSVIFMWLGERRGEPSPEMVTEDGYGSGVG